MATPKEALTGTDQPININSNAKASPCNQLIDNTDTVSFKNNDQSDAALVTFLGAGAGEFTYQGQPVTALTIPAGESVGPLTPVSANVTVNYNVKVATSSGEAFAIEVGTGPLEIDIVDDDGTTEPNEAGIPNNGSFFFKNESADDQASISFAGDTGAFHYQNGDPVVSPVVVAAGSSSATIFGQGTNKKVTYSIIMSAAAGGGNGTIKVGQT